MTAARSHIVLPAVSQRRIAVAVSQRRNVVAAVRLDQLDGSDTNTRLFTLRNVLEPLRSETIPSADEQRPAAADERRTDIAAVRFAATGR